MKSISGIFLKGLAAVLPIGVTLYLLYWIGVTAESLLGGLLRGLLPERWQHLPGLGLIAGVGLIFLLGALLNAYLVQQIWRGLERLVQRIPLVKTIFGAVHDLMSFFAPGRQRELGQVVSVPFGITGHRVLGFVTRPDLTDLPEAGEGEDMVAVYLPMSYQIGGYTVIMPRADLRPVDMSVEQAMRFVITAGVSNTKPPAPPMEEITPANAAPSGNA